MNNETAIEALKRLGTILEVRAVGKHAVIAENRQRMLRHVMHIIEKDLKRHDITLSIERLVRECI